MNKKVLLIEDDASLREIYSMALELDGYEVTSAENGREGLALLTNALTPYIPDCVVTDLRMPVMSGEKFIEVIRTSYGERFARVPIIVCTAFGGEVNKEWIFSRIQKPLSLDLLISTVELAIRKYENSRFREPAIQP